MSDPLPALRQAAAALLAEAPMPVVRGMLRALLADAEAPPRADAPPSPQQLQQPAPKPAPAPRPVRAAPPPDAAWDERRRAIRAAMLERGVSYPAMASRFGVKVPTLRHALSRRQPLGPAMRKRLDAWMKSSAPAPAVAEPAATFRPNGASKTRPAIGSPRTDASAGAGAAAVVG